MAGSFVVTHLSYFIWGLVSLAIIVWAGYAYIRHIYASHHYLSTKKQLHYFMWAIGLVYIAAGSPFTILANDYLFSAHVLQLSLVCFAFPPLFILGLPKDFLRRCFWHHRMKIAERFLRHPWIIGVVFNSLLTVYLVPSVFHYIRQSMVLTIAAQVLLAILAFFTWWFIIAPLPKMDRISHLAKVGFLFLAALLLMPIGIYLLVVQHVYYPLYAAQDLLTGLTPIYDQQLAGGVLKTFQLTSYMIALFYILRRWGKEEDDREGQVDDENIRIVRGVVVHLPKKK